MVGVEEILELQKKQMQEMKNAFAKAIMAPLDNGMMDENTHAEFKQDIDKLLELTIKGQKTEAESFLKMITEKYDKPNV